MRPTLSLLQQRVFGALIEKSLAQPAYYPMTLNAITAACNQKQNRHPVMVLSEGEVARAVHELQGMDLVALATPTHGARANRFAHQAAGKLNWDRPQQALLAELLLRGPQTPGELRTRASRMSASFQNLEIVANVINDLATRRPPLVVELEREPGKSATRFAHLLCPEDQVPRGSAPLGPDSAGVEPVLPPEWSQRLDQIERRFDQLLEKVARIEAKVNTRLP